LADLTSQLIAAFANYVLAANRIGTAIRCAQAWSYLRDVLLMILTRQFLGDDEPLALLICPVVCRALVFLVSRADSATGNATSRDVFLPSPRFPVAENRVMTTSAF
jgi:hypothetical protein